MAEEPTQDYQQVIQEFFKVPGVAQSSVRQDAMHAGVLPNVVTDEQKKKQETESKRKKEVHRRTLQMVLSTEYGRESLYDALVACNTSGNPFNPDTHLTAFNCGALLIGQNLDEKICDFSMDLYALMKREGRERAELMDKHINIDDAKPE